ncbi:MAG: 2-oxoacid:acceptor oxidoreductase subunit alpha [Proteobacteria bacterium]|nr:2-oxoacid:acceptor oxidoreductase subunit alpha [Desulfobacula sp.]MBU4133018.1 2-oxoacid:acceptor oxidoreductase subunit alpha [Pseudomonadota bacterium]
MNKRYDFSDHTDIAIVLSGEAGQGIKTLEYVLTRLLKKQGLNVFSCKEYMSRVRGGLNSIQIRISPEKVDAWVDRIDILIPLNPDLSRLEHRISSKTMIIGEKEKITTKQPVIEFSFQAAAEAAGGKKYANTVASGLILSLLHVDPSLLDTYLSQKFVDKPQKIIDANLEAAKLGVKKGRALVEKGVVKIQMVPVSKSDEKILVNGSQAVGMGAIAGGCDFVSSYPMSPGTGVLEFLAGQSNAFSFVVEQAEDEIAALNMVLGAWYAGARGFATTSGGGFALMGEAMSLAGITETPAVVHIAQRPGPATGLPTRTEQGDLNLALYSGHGDFVRAIFAPGNLDQAFYLTANAFNLADAYQIPVLILTDQYLMDSAYTIPVWDLDPVSVKKGFVKTDSDYCRYRYTRNGLSPRGVPGYGKGLVCVDSDEHDEKGRITEDWKTREKMMKKRMKRLKVLEDKALMPSVHGNPDGDIVVVAWGSPHNMVLSALQNAGNPRMKYLHFSQVYPLNPRVRDTIEGAKKLVLVENNYSGQFGDLLFKTFGRKMNEKILLSNGFPFSTEFLTRKFKKIQGD